jgi:thiamine pyrophosphate-dependent acetolactate synthase large subunit-like protein
VTDRYGSDLVVSLLDEAGVEYVAFNPGATFRGIHDSLVHREGAGAPRIILCAHEAVAVAVGQGYAKAAGQPMAVLLHDVVGLQNGSMAVYNAWCDRTPVLLIGGTGPMSKVERRPWIDWIHTALVQGEQVRDYVKWDDQPVDLASVPESFARAWTTAQSAPPGPVYLCLDAALQEQELPGGQTRPPLSAYPVPSAPTPAPADLTWLAEELAQARLPVLLTDYAGATSAGFDALQELAELLHAPVVDYGARLSFPTRHELAFAGLEDDLADADLLVALDVEDLAGGLRTLPRGARVVNISPAHLRLRSWAHDYQQLVPVERHLSGSCETSLPALVEALRARPPDEAHVADRRARLADTRRQAAERWRGEAAAAEGAGAIAPARLALELDRLLEGELWTLVHGSLGGWERRLWSFERFGQHLGWHGGGGLGYGLGASIGATLALPGETLALNIQPDGDLLYTPSALWTAARYRVPLLTVVHNNRQYQNTVEHAARMAGDRGHDPRGRYEGAGLRDPDVDFAGLARSLGVWAKGPIARIEDVEPAFAEARAIVASGRPALIDVLTAGA